MVSGLAEENIAIPRSVTIRDRLIGGIVGLVIGDAIGVPVEFSSRLERKQDPVQGMRAWGTHLQPRGTWSDDGALALAHADAFMTGGWCPESHLEAFAAWYRDGAYAARGQRFDIGGTTSRALRRYLAGADLDLVGGQAEHDNGNGSLMRILPASCWWAGEAALDQATALGRASALTHAHPVSRLACAWHGRLVAGLLAERSVAAILAQAGRELADVEAGEGVRFAALAAGEVLHLPCHRVPSDGFVISTLAAASWCLDRHPDYAGAVLAAVNLGGDTDTTAAVVGGLAGLRCGFSGLPRAWTTCLPRRRWLLTLAEGFAEACTQRLGVDRPLSRWPAATTVPYASEATRSA